MFQQAIEFFVKNVLTKKPVKINIVSEQITKPGQVNRQPNCVSISFTNIGRRTAFINKIPLFTGGFYTVVLSEGETDITDYNVQFDKTTTVGNTLVIAVFKYVRK